MRTLNPGYQSAVEIALGRSRNLLPGLPQACNKDQQPTSKCWVDSVTVATFRLAFWSCLSKPRPVFGFQPPKLSWRQAPKQKWFRKWELQTTGPSHANWNCHIQSTSQRSKDAQQFCLWWPNLASWVYRYDWRLATPIRQYGNLGGGKYNESERRLKFANSARPRHSNIDKWASKLSSTCVSRRRQSSPCDCATLRTDIFEGRHESLDHSPPSVRPTLDESHAKHWLQLPLGNGRTNDGYDRGPLHWTKDGQARPFQEKSAQQAVQRNHLHDGFLQCQNLSRTNQKAAWGHPIWKNWNGLLAVHDSRWQTSEVVNRWKLCFRNRERRSNLQGSEGHVRNHDQKTWEVRIRELRQNGEKLDAQVPHSHAQSFSWKL